MLSNVGLKFCRKIFVVGCGVRGINESERHFALSLVTSKRKKTDRTAESPSRGAEQASDKPRLCNYNFANLHSLIRIYLRMKKKCVRAAWDSPGARLEKRKKILHPGNAVERVTSRKEASQ